VLIERKAKEDGIKFSLAVGKKIEEPLDQPDKMNS
jgi:hypothetical protein